MPHAIKDQQLGWSAEFDCRACDGEGTTEDGFGAVECDECEGNGVVELDCMLHFDIIPGTPATGLSGPPENYDPGSGPEITKLAVMIGDKDETSRVLNIDEAEEFICDEWKAPEPDRSDEPDYEAD